MNETDAVVETEEDRVEVGGVAVDVPAVPSAPRSKRRHLHPAVVIGIALFIAVCYGLAGYVNSAVARRVGASSWSVCDEGAMRGKVYGVGQR